MRATDKPFNIDKRLVYEAYKAVKSKGGRPGSIRTRAMIDRATAVSLYDVFFEVDHSQPAASSRRSRLQDSLLFDGLDIRTYRITRAGLVSPCKRINPGGGE